MKAISLISGGIDSPVASYIALKNKIDVVFLHFDNGIFYDKKELEKVKSIIELFSKKFKKSFKLYVCDFEVFHKKVLDKEIRRYHCLICKRTMFKLAERIALKEKADFLISGENLSQVASQTKSNLKVIDSATKLFVLRPLLVFDKEETINIAKEIGTYEISTIKTIGCSAVPKNPATKSDLNFIIKEEKRLEIDKIVKEILKSTKFIEIE
ncbi:MAG: 7-cyano-7-deazaguanine synthase [Candidatus Woesearchaeota archaeon]